MVTTTRVTHATPAATYAHICHRDLENDIAAQVVPGGAGYNPLLGAGLDVIFGGGRRHFLPTSVSGGKRTDGRNLVDELQAGGYAYASDHHDASRDRTRPTTDKAVSALFTGSHMTYDLDRDPGSEPSLADMTTKAMDILGKNPDGYFLMVEGGRIDHALHETNAQRALQDTVAFDDAIKTAIDKMKLKDADLKNTLIVVTADHDHTLVMNGYAKRTGKTTASNAGVLGLVKNVTTGANDLDADGVPYSILGFGNGENRDGPALAAANRRCRVSADDYHQEAAIRMPVGSETHGGTDVFLGAIGLGADNFHRLHDQHRRLRPDPPSASARNTARMNPGESTTMNAQLLVRSSRRCPRRHGRGARRPARPRTSSSSSATAWAPPRHRQPHLQATARTACSTWSSCRAPRRSGPTRTTPRPPTARRRWPRT